MKENFSQHIKVLNLLNDEERKLSADILSTFSQIKCLEIKKSLNDESLMHTTAFKTLLEKETDIAIISNESLPYPLHYDIQIIALVANKSNWKEAIAESELCQLTQKHSGIVFLALRDRTDLQEVFQSIDIRTKFGSVTLVGFGPGDPELLTMKAVKAAYAADVILYDDLINTDFLNELYAKKIYVGKRRGNHSSQQNEINLLMYKHALSGKKIVRLKGGDPMIFGRGGEEIEYLQERFINVLVIPGVTSALAAACAAKISLTQRSLSSSVAFCTGHSGKDIQVPNANTLVYFMAAVNILELLERIVKSGRRESTPVAIIYNCSLHDEQITISSIKEIKESGQSFPSPIILIIGDSVLVNNSSRNDIYALAQQLKYDFDVPLEDYII